MLSAMAREPAPGMLPGATDPLARGLAAYAAHPPFIGVDAFLEAVARGNHPHVIDARGADSAQRGRVPGAVPVPARELHPVHGGVRKLADSGALVDRLSQHGIGRDAVVIYGGGGGADAAHLWWTLHYLGHEHAYLLDGGFEAWRDAGHPIEDGPVPEAVPTKRPLPRRPLPDRAIELPELRARVGEPRLAILDARTPREYGRASETGAHIPGATLFTWSDALGGGTELRDRDALRARLASVLAADEVVTYCQSGVRAAHAYALLRWLGHPRPRLYLGSWAEWSQAADTPSDSA